MSPSPGSAMALAPDHLVVMADSLEAGVHWCESVLGVTPGPGGEHPLMGTHNRLFCISSAPFPDTFFEIIALQPGVVPARTPGLQRWFDMDDPALRERVRRDGPQLIHWVAQCRNLAALLLQWQALGLQPGPALPASRMTPAGLLQWQITVRDDGRRQLDGLLPTLLQWEVAHPAARMSEVGVQLKELRLRHPQADLLRQALQACSTEALSIETGPARLTAILQTPKGTVELHT